MFSTQYPYSCTTTRYETDNIVVTSASYGTNDIRKFILNKEGVSYPYDSWIRYDFKTPITPKQIRLQISTGAYSCIGYVQYLIDDQWVTQVETPRARSIDEVYELPNTKISSIRLFIGSYDKVGTQVPYGAFGGETTIYFDTTSAMVKNKVANVIMQNEFFSKFTSSAEIIED